MRFEVEGWPPRKDRSVSIRNSQHREHQQFQALRAAAIAAMNGRVWYQGPVGLDVTIFGPESGRIGSLNDYLGDIQDSLDGSHGHTFTYLPVVFENDSQVCEVRTDIVDAARARYEVLVTFLAAES